jgi:hypothetical protein
MEMIVYIFNRYTEAVYHPVLTYFAGTFSMWNEYSQVGCIVNVITSEHL